MAGLTRQTPGGATGRVGRAGLAALLLTLAACASAPEAPPQPPIPATAPRTKPAVPQVDQAQLRRERAQKARAEAAMAMTAANTPASRNMRDYLVNVEDTLVRRGLLRTDDGRDIALTPEMLTRNFIQIALHDEYLRKDGRLIQQQTPAPLRRWQEPVQIQLVFGDSVDQGQRSRDRADVSALVTRLAAASQHPVSVTGARGNFVVLFLSEDERRAIGPRLTSLVPGIPAADVSALQELSPQNYCTVFAYARGAGQTYAQAVALIRAETPARLRRSCIHEEITQGLGLANDSPKVRPTIFNDDEEFAYLTHQDELLLRILYDPRLHPGMTVTEAEPIVAQISRELLGAGA